MNVSLFVLQWEMKKKKRSSNGREHGVTSKFKFTFNWSVCVVVVVVAVAHSHLSLSLSVQKNVHKFTIRQNFYFSSPSIQSAWRVFVCARFQRKWFCDRVYRRDSWIVVAGFVRMFFLFFFFCFSVSELMRIYRWKCCASRIDWCPCLCVGLSVREFRKRSLLLLLQNHCKTEWLSKNRSMRSKLSIRFQIASFHENKNRRKRFPLNCKWNTN